MSSPPDPATLLQEAIRDARQRMAAHLAELHRLHLVLANDSRALKHFTTAGQAQAEIELASELLEQYLAASHAFLENMRGRFEARLGLLRRGEPGQGLHREDAPGHAGFWLGFSRLCAVLRRVGRSAEG
ncbi:MAG: hypothetical protein KGL12_04960 [Rhodospirillales bacterium]|nr:hypothetical protein [Rhodospirillales bacterium]